MKVRQAVAALIFCDNQILLVKKQKVESNVAQFEPHWDVPKGGIEHGESERSALYRELAEELAIIPEDMGQIDSFDEKIEFKFPFGSEFDAQSTTVFEVNLKTRANIQITSQEIGELKWVSRAEAMALLPKNETREFLKQHAIHD